MDADGGNLTKVHHEPRDLLGMPIVWTPDGRRIVFVSESPGYTALYSMRPDGSAVQELFPDLRIGGCRDPLVAGRSLDHRRRCAPGDLPGDTPGVLLIRANGSQMFKVAGGGLEPSWRPDVT